jgi:flagellar assembly protein FliH
MSSDWRVSQFEYPSVMNGSSDAAPGLDQSMWKTDEDRRLKQETALREAQARELGRAEGEAKAKSHYEELLRKERQKVADTLHQFAADRAAYFERVETEVVQLSMAIARKVVHREAQLDPNLLMGLVRYTLDKLRDGTRVKVTVNPANAGAWQQMFSGDGDNLELVFNAQIEPGLCVVESELGMTSVSVENQLKEIEQGLMDLLARRPETK